MGRRGSFCRSPFVQPKAFLAARGWIPGGGRGEERLLISAEHSHDGISPNALHVGSPSWRKISAYFIHRVLATQPFFAAIYFILSLLIVQPVLGGGQPKRRKFISPPPPTAPLSPGHRRAPRHDRRAERRHQRRRQDPLRCPPPAHVRAPAPPRCASSPPPPSLTTRTGSPIPRDRRFVSSSRFGPSQCFPPQPLCGSSPILRLPPPACRTERFDVHLCAEYI